jgi:S1-C subfamily serine protease
MSISLTQVLTGLSDAVAGLVDQAAPLLAAIRTTPGRHISGIIWQPDLVITADQLLPARDSYTVVLAGGILVAARPAGRDTANNLAALRLETKAGALVIRTAGPARVGGLALALGATAEANPVVRLTVIHRVDAARVGVLSSATMDMLSLDLPPNTTDDGGPVLDASGALLGMCASSATGQALVVPHMAIAAVLPPAMAIARGRRGWLGLSLQPIAVPDSMRPIAQQDAGRMVVNLASNGPAEQAGIRAGDILLSLDGQSINAPRTLRTFLSPDRIGRYVEIKLLREGALETIRLAVSVQPEA